MTDFQLVRRNQLREILELDGLDGILVTTEKNVRYLSGFTGDSTWMIITPETEVILSDFRYITQIEEECPGVELFIRNSKMSLAHAAAGKVQDLQLKKIGFESHTLSVDQLKTLQTEFDHAELIPCPWRIEELRSVKDEFEIAEIREAVRLAERGFAFLKSILTPEATELELAHELEHAVRRFGGEELSFHPIIAVGDRAALPHYRPGKLKIKDSPILLVDWGAQTEQGYKSDLTRTMLTAKFDDPKFRDVYETVLEAQRLAIEKIAARVSCLEIDSIARDYIQQRGYGQYFDHGLGHGIGLDIHELPRFSPSVDSTLEAGMVVTVEPGIYLPGWGGVRIEDDVLVTEGGCDVLSSVPKDWDSVQIEV